MARPPALAVVGVVLIGLASGIPFAPVFQGAARLRPDAQAAAIGLVNGAASTVILVGTPLLGLAFSLPGGGRAGFVVVAVLWAQGHNGATVRLEHLWHEVCEREAFSLFCAYPRSGFTQDAEVSMKEICAAHSKVIAG